MRIITITYRQSDGLLKAILTEQVDIEEEGLMFYGLTPQCEHLEYTTIPWSDVVAIV